MAADDNHIGDAQACEMVRSGASCDARAADDHVLRGGAFTAGIFSESVHSRGGPASGAVGTRRQRQRNGRRAHRLLGNAAGAESSQLLLIARANRCEAPDCAASA
jgi:hypothetical protein